MKRMVLLLVIVFTTVSATACGSSTPAATQAPPAQPVATEAQVQPVATDAPTQPAATEAPTEPTATEAPATSGGGTVVTITLADNTINSSLTEFKTGVPYTFNITNTGQRSHTFDISTPVSIVGSLNTAQSTALLDIPKSQLPPGTNLSVDYTFPDSAAGAPLEFSCLIPMHYQDGMYLAITVTN